MAANGSNEAHKMLSKMHRSICDQNLSAAYGCMGASPVVHRSEAGAEAQLNAKHPQTDTPAEYTKGVRAAARAEPPPRFHVDPTVLRKRAR